MKNFRSLNLLHLLYVFNSYGKIATFSTKRSGEECWVRLGSST